MLLTFQSISINTCPDLKYSLPLFKIHLQKFTFTQRRPNYKRLLLAHHLRPQPLTVELRPGPVYLRPAENLLQAQEGPHNHRPVRAEQASRLRRAPTARCRPTPHLHKHLQGLHPQSNLSGRLLRPSGQCRRSAHEHETGPGQMPASVRQNPPPNRPQLCSTLPRRRPELPRPSHRNQQDSCHLGVINNNIRSEHFNVKQPECQLQQLSDQGQRRQSQGALHRLRQ